MLINNFYSLFKVLTYHTKIFSCNIKYYNTIVYVLYNIARYMLEKRFKQLEYEIIKVTIKQKHRK